MALDTITPKKNVEGGCCGETQTNQNYPNAPITGTEKDKGCQCISNPVVSLIFGASEARG